MGIEGLLTGRVLLDRYRVDAVLGRGGMGVVYRATDTRLGRGVAVKVLVEPSLDLESRSRARARFEREAVESARLHHPNVVRIYDFGTDTEHDLDVLVMELLQGRDLAGWMEAEGVPPLPVALGMLAQAARGLGAGHQLRLVHRDVKPGNLFVSGPADRPVVHVLDFGIVEMLNPEGTVTQLTVLGFTPHSVRYASPEQLRGGTPLTPASDVFSLAITGFELLTGERAFEDGEIPSRHHAADTLIPRLERHSDPAEVVQVMACALHHDPESRFADGDAFADALEAAAVRRPAVEAARIPPPLPSMRPAPPLPVHRAPLPSMRPAPPLPTHPAPVRSGRGAAVATAGFAFAGLCVAIAAAMSIQEPAAGGSTPETTAGSFVVPTDTAEVPVTAATAGTTDIESAIDQIRSDFQRIEGVAAHLSTREISLEGFSTEGGVAKVYQDGPQVEKVSATHFGEMGKSVVDFYFRGNALIFAYRREYRYDTPFGNPVGEPEENRFYFDRGSLVRWRGSDQQLVPATNPTYAAQESELLRDAESLLNAAQSGAASIVNNSGT